MSNRFADVLRELEMAKVSGESVYFRSTSVPPQFFKADDTLSWTKITLSEKQDTDHVHSSIDTLDTKTGFSAKGI